ncbi:MULTISPECIES: hypothetical protein [unclassified Leptolyngbya]|uniref:hypothetical protein n=1 Tax=unclassified Leptolyngbya TaxID=2650499 RepID=UPI0016881ADD|nr:MULTISPECIES: hypothetical protein [unclassified Leptolyngbya]MBD1912238.1 hypothetical protein [Leptolyngbya sp. FACHB-8]MBD2155129.1 hypothetical protein [Leptolyngbya sp. FACHB-16]
MQIFRQYIAPLLVVLIFALALVAVSARIFLPTDMAAPAPIEDVDQVGRAPMPDSSALADVPPTLEQLVRGIPVELEPETAL